MIEESIRLERGIHLRRRKLKLVALVGDPLSAPARRLFRRDQLESMTAVQVGCRLEFAEGLEPNEPIADVHSPCQHLLEQAAAQSASSRLRAEHEPSNR